MAVPLGASSFWVWCISSIETLYSGCELIILARILFISKKILTPILKLDAYKKAVSEASHIATASWYFSSHPVVPATTGIPLCKALEILAKALLGVLNSIAISAWVISYSSEEASIFRTILCPLSIAIFSMVFPIFPYPNRAIFIVFAFLSYRRAKVLKKWI